MSRFPLWIGAQGAGGAAVSLAGSASITTTASGSLGVTQSLAGSSTISVGASGSLGVQQSLNGTAAVTVGATGTLVKLVSLSGTAAVTIGATGTLDILIPWENPSSYIVTTGNYNSGTIEDVQDVGGGSLLLDEVTGTPGFLFDFTFGEEIAVPTTDLVFCLTGRYKGNPIHIVKLQQWNYNSTTWVNVTAAVNDFPSGPSDQNFSFPLINDPDYLSGGQLQLRFNHTSPGNPTHDFNFDHIGLNCIALEGSASVTVAASGSLGVAYALAGASSITVGMTGLLGLQRPLAGSAAVVVTASGLLGNQILLAGAAAVNVSATGQISILFALAGQSDIIVSATGTLAATLALAGTSDVIVAALGRLTAQWALAGSVSVVVSASGTLITQIQPAWMVPVNQIPLNAMMSRT